jgi:hypothetical protein
VFLFKEIIVVYSKNYMKDIKHSVDKMLRFFSILKQVIYLYIHIYV